MSATAESSTSLVALTRKENEMRKKLPSPAMIVALIALSVSLAGNAGAFNGGHKIRKGEIAKGAVTASTIAKGAVKASALARGAVTAKALASGSVGAADLAKNAVTASAVAPNSIGGYALGPVTIHSATITDLDSSPDLSTWTSSNSESAVCGEGERLLSGGVVITNPGNRRVGTIASVPISNASTNAFVGQITSDSGGLAQAQVQVLCLK